MKLTVLCIYPIFPPNSGYKNRCYFLYKELAKYMDVELISLTGPNQPTLKKEIAPNLFEIRIPKTATQAEKETQIAKKLNVSKEVIYDITQMILFNETPDFVQAFLDSAQNADYVVLTQPYFYPMFEKYSDKKFIYDSHNVEYILKQQLLENNNDAEFYLDMVFKNEEKTCENAQFVTVCTANRDDAAGFEQLFNIPDSKIYNIPIGADLENINFVDQKERKSNKEKENITQKLALFIGSAHLPNIEACKHIIDIALKSPEVLLCRDMLQCLSTI